MFSSQCLRSGLRFRLCAVVALALGALVACKGNEPPAQVPMSIVVTPASVDFHAIGATRQVGAAVLDQKGDTIRGAKVTWQSLDASVATVDANGKITSVAVGAAQIHVASSTAPSVAATVAVTVTQVAAQLVKVTTIPPSATVGSQLLVTVRVVDSANTAVPGAIVDFTVTQGGGTVSAPKDTTVSDGLASVGWQLGTSTGANAVLVSLVGGVVTAVSFTTTATSGPPVVMTIQAGDGQTAHAGSAVTTPPAVLLRDGFNNPASGVIVRFTVTSGSGVVTKPVDTTGANGVAAPTAWTLGTAGTNTLEASVSLSGVSGNPQAFTATATPAGAATQVAVYTGNGQTGLLGYALNFPPAVRVLDAANGPVAGVQVDFAVTGGGGSVTGATATTNLFGVAAVGSWTVQAGANSLTATVTGSGIAGNPVGFTATGVNSTYNISLRYLKSLSSSRKAVFDSAAARWQRLIFGDVPDVTVTSTDVPAGTCGSNSPAVNETIDDIIIFVTLDSIDGPGKVLGRAGPCYVRLPGFLSLIGIMRFDTADVASLESSGTFQLTILHEMGHVLGFGTLWGSTELGLLVGPRASGGTDPHFVGAQATAAFDAHGGAGYSSGAKVPVENCVNPPPGLPCGEGQWDGHWRETVFDHELMTPYLDQGSEPLSVISIAAMGDEGYMVNYAGADAYTVTNPLAIVRAQPGPVLQLWDDILHLPIRLVDPSGRVVRVIQPQ